MSGVTSLNLKALPFEATKIGKLSELLQAKLISECFTMPEFQN